MLSDTIHDWRHRSNPGILPSPPHFEADAAGGTGLLGSFMNNADRVSLIVLSNP